MSCQNMNKAVKLEEIINVFEMQSDDTMVFLNKNNKRSYSDRLILV